MQWEFLSECLLPELGKGVECPDIFELDQKTVFLGAARGILKDGLEYSDAAMWSFAEFEQSSGCMKLLGKCRYIDYGLDLYASQTCLDENGRRVMIAWMRMPAPVEEPDGTMWRGMMCQPRVLSVRDGQLCFSPHPNTEQCFTQKSENGVLSYPCRIRAELEEGDLLDIGGYEIRYEDHVLKTDRHKVWGGWEGFRLSARTERLEKDCSLDIYASCNMIEVFVNGGQCVLSHVIYSPGTELKFTGRRVPEIFPCILTNNHEN